MQVWEYSNLCAAMHARTDPCARIVHWPRKDSNPCASPHAMTTHAVVPAASSILHASAAGKPGAQTGLPALSTLHSAAILVAA